jgi:hypothetical protein
MNNTKVHQTNENTRRNAKNTSVVNIVIKGMLIQQKKEPQLKVYPFGRRSNKSMLNH